MRPLESNTCCKHWLHTCIPADILHNYDVVITSRRHHLDVVTTLLLRHLFNGMLSSPYSHSIRENRTLRTRGNVQLRRVWLCGELFICRWLPLLNRGRSHKNKATQIAKFMGPTWDPSGSCRPQMGPLLAPWTLLSGNVLLTSKRCLELIIFAKRGDAAQSTIWWAPSCFPDPKTKIKSVRSCALKAATQSSAKLDGSFSITGRGSVCDKMIILQDYALRWFCLFILEELCLNILWQSLYEFESSGHIDHLDVFI